MEKNSFIILRHGYDDHSYIDGKNDTPLISRGIKESTAAAAKIASLVAVRDTIIRYSTKQRAHQTAEMIKHALEEKSINCKCIEDFGLTELFQGVFNFNGLTHEERGQFLHNCWVDFEKCRAEGNIYHRFGQNQDRSVIIELGENHAEWSVRIAQGFLHIINDLENNKQSINVTHRGATFEIDRLVQLANGQIPMREVEQYEAVWMPYCQDYSFHIDNLDKAKSLVYKYIDSRSK